jgi:hypothetical protein
MTLDLSHLARPAKEQAFLDTKSRIKLVQTARWVGFERAQLAVDELERRYHYPSRPVFSTPPLPPAPGSRSVNNAGPRLTDVSGGST